MVTPIPKNFRTKRFVSRPPRFGGSMAGIKNSPYYWWWEFLRRNDRYIKCCKSGGKGTYSSLYRDFGDVRSNNFERWWRERGESLFSETSAPVTMGVVTDVKQLQEMDLRNCITIVLPLTVSKRDLKKRFGKILMRVHQGHRGGNRFGQSTALYQLAAKPVVKTLETTLKVYDLARDHPDWPLWKIGRAARVSPEHAVYSNQPMSHQRDARNALAQKTSRYLKDARAYVNNTVKGNFPKK